MWIDILAVGIIGGGFALGYRRGLVKTVFDTLSILVALLLTLKLSPLTMKLLEWMMDMHPGVSFVLGIIVTFAALMIGVRLMGKAFEEGLKAVNLDQANLIIGGLIQGFFFGALISYFIGMLDGFELIAESTKEKSLSYPMLAVFPEVTAWLWEALKPAFSTLWEKKDIVLKKLEMKG